MVGAPLIGSAFARRARSKAQYNKSAAASASAMAASYASGITSSITTVAQLMEQQGAFLQSSIENSRIQNDLLIKIIDEVKTGKLGDGAGQQSWLNSIFSYAQYAFDGYELYRYLRYGRLAAAGAGAVAVGGAGFAALGAVSVAALLGLAIESIINAPRTKEEFEPAERKLEGISRELRVFGSNPIGDIPAADSKELKGKSEQEAMMMGMSYGLSGKSLDDWMAKWRSSNQAQQNPTPAIPSQPPGPPPSISANQQQTGTSATQQQTPPVVPQTQSTQPASPTSDATQAAPPPPATSGSAAAPVGQTGNTSEAIQFFISKGWSQEQAAGIVANLHWESGGLQTDAVGDGGKAFGIAQWHPDRQQNFQRIYGKPIQQSTFQEQLSFVDWELNNSEKKAGNIIRNAKTAEEAAALTDQYYERSSGIHRKQRIDLANSFMGGQIPQAQPARQASAPRTGEALNQVSMSDEAASVIRRVTVDVSRVRGQVDSHSASAQRARASISTRGERSLEEVLLEMVN